MSHDVCVWYPHRKLTKDEAAALFLQLIEGDTSGVQSHASLDAFYKELTSLHPEIDDDPSEECPWAMEFERSPGHILMSVSWSRAEEMFEVICELATKHGLAVIETEQENPIYPDGPVE